MLKVVTNLKLKHYGDRYIQKCHIFREKFGPHFSFLKTYIKNISNTRKRIVNLERYNCSFKEIAGTLNVK